MKKSRRILTSLMASAVVLLCAATPVYASSGAWEKGYTYNFDYWKEVQYCPDAYEVAGVYTDVELKLVTGMKDPQGLFVYEDSLYVCDSGNDRILEFKVSETGSFELERTIMYVRGNTSERKLNGPTDICIRDGYIYICDKKNARIVKADMEMNYVMEFTKPDDTAFVESFDYLPNKLAVDSAGRVYCIADNVNRGIIKYEADGTFSGFFGATPVTYNWADYIWKRMLSTRAQRDQMASFTPTEYDDLYMDNLGFIYACTSKITESSVRSGESQPIRRLNLTGSNILIENGNFKVIGDIYWRDVAAYIGNSKMTDITALDNGIYFALDRVRGRIFAYDQQGNLLYAFGGVADTDGCFRSAKSLTHMGNNLFVLDGWNNSITVFTPTEFGSLIFKAIEEYDAGDYAASGDTWGRVMELDGNYDQAYIGIGRALMREGEYKEAMKYFRLKWDTDNYSKAYKQYRKQWVEQNIGWVVAILLVLIVVPLVRGRIRKVKFQIDTSEYLRRKQ